MNEDNSKKIINLNISKLINNVRDNINNKLKGGKRFKTRRLSKDRIKKFGEPVKRRRRRKVKSKQNYPPRNQPGSPKTQPVSPMTQKVGSVAEQVSNIAEQVSPMAQQVSPIAQQDIPMAQQVSPVTQNTTNDKRMLLIYRRQKQNFDKYGKYLELNKKILDQRRKIKELENQLRMCNGNIKSPRRPMRSRPMRQSPRGQRRFMRQSPRGQRPMGQRPMGQSPRRQSPRGQRPMSSSPRRPMGPQ